MTKWIGPEEAEYDERRVLFHAMINKKPRIIAACEDPADVREALERTAHDRLPVAVRSGGYSVAGQSSNDDGLVIDDPPGFRHYWSADYHDTSPNDPFDVFLHAGARRASPMTQHLLPPWGGALARVDADATPLSQRSARWVSHPFATWEDPADDAANIAWVRDYRKANVPFTAGGVYLNFIGAEGDDRIKAAIGAEKYERLAQIKSEYDPGNVFAGNQNIRPKVSA